MAIRTEALLSEMHLRNPAAQNCEHSFCVTDMPFRFQDVGERFLGRSLTNVRVVKW